MLASMQDLGAQGITEEVTDLADFIKEKIWQDPKAADLQWSLFTAAMNSYRYDSVLRPFPPMFQQGDGEKDHTAMQELVKEVPTLPRIPRECHKFSQKLLELMKWVLDSKSFTLTVDNINKMEEVKKLTGYSVKVPTPNFIFEVTPSTSAQEKFSQLQGDRKLLYAFHGSRLENFHSILHNGLASHMNKTSVFGEGTYLSAELSVSLIYSPTGTGWEQSELGHSLSCVAVCEMIDDPAVKCQNKLPTSRNSGNNGSPTNSRANAGPSEGGDVPDKYYVVQNNEMIRVKYLLIYAHKASSHRSRNPTSWIAQYKFGLMLFSYFVVLCAVGLMNTQTFKNVYRKMWKSR